MVNDNYVCNERKGSGGGGDTHEVSLVINGEWPMFLAWQISFDHTCSIYVVYVKKKKRSVCAWKSYKRLGLET